MLNIVYMDDLLVFTKTGEEHVEHLWSVFERIRKFGLKLATGKSLIGKEKIHFLSQTISKDPVEQIEVR